MSDVNVTEKVAQALCPSLWDDTYPEHLREELRHLPREYAATALAALSDPEVLAGMAGVLREHGDSRQSAGGFLLVCRCGDAVDDHAAHQATAVADWLRGQG